MRALVWAAVSTVKQAEDEKFSISKQVEDARRWCKENGHDIIDEMVVMGHSRSYRDIHELARAASKQGIDAFDRLINHFNAKDFDVLVCRDANRFARKASLLHWVVETIIEDCGAKIFSFADGWVTSGNANMFAAFKGFQTQSEMKWLLDASMEGRRKLTVAGGYYGGKVGYGYKVVRGESGKAIGYALDETKRPVLDAIAELMLEGVSWAMIPREMKRRYGLVNADGDEFDPNFAYQLMHRATTWGHLCFSRRRRGYYEAWMFDDALSPPANITVGRNVLPGLYPADMRPRLIEEIQRRHAIGSGGKRKESEFFWGRNLFVCDICGAKMVKTTIKNGGKVYVYIRCSHRFRLNRCGGQMAKEADVKQYVEWMLFAVLEGGDSWFDDDATEVEVEKAERLDKSIKALQHKIENWINELGQTDNDAIKAMYREKIKGAGEQMQTMMAQAQADEMKAVKVSKHAQNRELLRRNVLGMLASVGPERAFADFWGQPAVKINQFLSGLLGGRKIAIRGKKVVGVV